MQRVDSLEKTLMLGGIGGRRRRDNGGWDGWMASLTRWAWVSVNSRSWWWTGRPGVLRFIGSRRVGHDWATDLIWSDWLYSLWCTLHPYDLVTLYLLSFLFQFQPSLHPSLSGNYQILLCIFEPVSLLLRLFICCLFVVVSVHELGVGFPSLWYLHIPTLDLWSFCGLSCWSCSVSPRLFLSRNSPTCRCRFSVYG